VECAGEWRINWSERGHFTRNRGTAVTITGYNFGSTAGTVTIAGATATVAAGNWTGTQIITIVPAGAADGATNVVVTTYGTALKTSRPFTVTSTTTTWHANGVQSTEAITALQPKILYDTRAGYTDQAVMLWVQLDSVTTKQQVYIKNGPAARGVQQRVSPPLRTMSAASINGNFTFPPLWLRTLMNNAGYCNGHSMILLSGVG
jgi:hypothetical protein